MDSINDNDLQNTLSDKKILYKSLDDKALMAVVTELSKDLKVESDPNKTSIPVTSVKSSKPSKKKKNRCNFSSCKGKLGHMPYECKCGGQFCGLHQYGWEHECQFNFKKENKDVLASKMVKLERSKLVKI